MYKVFFVLLTVFAGTAFAHGDNSHSMGTEADAMKAAGEVYHQQGISAIRKMHPEWMNHKRDETLRQGVRSEEHSLKACVHCHSTKKPDSSYHPINADGEFCSACHKKVSVSMDCFACHRTTPGEGAK